jgi:hypothetical protein
MEAAVISQYNTARDIRNESMCLETLFMYFNAHKNVWNELAEGCDAWRFT